MPVFYKRQPISYSPKGEPLPNINSESLEWLDNLAAITNQLEKNPDATHAELGKALNIDRGKITVLLAIKACLDPVAIEKVRQAAQANPPYTLSFNSARALAGLKKKKVSDFHGSVHAALDVIFAQRLETRHIKALVEWMLSGKPASEFDPKAKPPETTEEITEPESEEENTKRNNTKKVETKTLGQRIGSGIDKIVSLLGSGSSKEPSGTSTHPGSQQAPKKVKASGHGFSKSLTAKEKKAALKWTKKLAKKAAKFSLKEVAKAEHEVCKKLAHAIVSSRSSSHSTSSRRSGRAHSRGSFRQGLITLFLTVLHAVVYVLLQFGLLWMVARIFVFPFLPWLKPLLEWPFRFAAHLALYDLPSWVWACAHNYLVPTLVIGMVLAIGLVFAWQAEPLRMTLISAALVYLIIHGRGWAVESAPWDKPIVSETPAVSVPTAVPEAVRSLHLGSSQLKTSNSKLSTHHSPPAAAYQPAVSFIPNPSSTKTLYDPKILELEIAAIPANSIIKDYIFQPDEGMPADLAVSRLQNLTDSDKYTMMIGSGKVKILSVIPSNTNFIIAYKSTDIFGVFGNSSGTMNIFLEDVKYIHINEIDHFSKPPINNGDGPGAQPDVKYQCTVVAKGAKYPLTIQCTTTDDLENLVSTLEYFIRHSRLARDAQPAGLPYPTQGIGFNNDRVVTLLWANSPMDKGGVNLGDHPWSVGKATTDQQSRKDLEAGLSTLPATLFVVSPAEWDKAQIAARQPGVGNAFQPKLRRVSLTQQS